MTVCLPVTGSRASSICLLMRCCNFCAGVEGGPGARWLVRIQAPGARRRCVSSLSIRPSAAVRLRAPPPLVEERQRRRLAERLSTRRASRFSSSRV
eukprot:scaffold101770_cov28-Tisochrysis_lutea.AAC.2